MSCAISPLHQAAKRWPHQVAVQYWDAASASYQPISYQQLSQQVLSVAQQLSQQGLTLNSRLMVTDDNSLEQIILYWACVEIGVLFCPISAKFPAQQVTDLANIYHYQYCWTSLKYQSLRPKNSTAVDIDLSADNGSAANDAGQFDWQRGSNVILTSGSSGTPKGVVHCMDNHVASARGSAQLIDLSIGDAWLLSLPLFHIGGLAIVNRCAVAGAAVVLPIPTASLAEQLQAVSLSHLSLVAAQLIKLLADNPQQVKSLKALPLGGGAVATSLTQQLKQLGCSAYTSYGMTEMSSQITTGDANLHGSGELLSYRQLKLVEQRIYVKGETLFKGYLYPQGNAEGHQGWYCPVDTEGWFDTQDRGEWLNNGQLHILGRSDNMFICGGENIQPEEIEQALCCHPLIDDAIVYPIEDDRFGWLPAAIVKGPIAASGIEQSQLDQFLQAKIARFKRPRHYSPWPNVPQTGLKISRKAIIAAVLASPPAAK
ncbi:o-succinylbenzoate--CoA ligase [Shewanella waksmanii]|uniref:o-succinylbenzoate--CoA ligase n=1 Tax=Shewanella waksmanii TaxID=213783 RepID=UPI0004907283|nr:o-succinylbenzoate--CoA ligase [Shewanella waksmanii]